MSKHYDSFDEYYSSIETLSAEERAQIEFEADLISKFVKARNDLGLSQRDLAMATGIKQPVIARIETLVNTPKVDTLIKLLYPLGYTLAIVPRKIDASITK